MSNVASLELCKELYTLSGWAGTYGYFEYGYEQSPVPGVSGHKNKPFHSEAWDEDEKRTPAYDLGYLLRKLQPSLHEVKENAFRHDEFDYELQLQWQSEEKNWLCWYVFQHYKGEADTPEDAACKLAIELFEQGVLTK